MSLFDIEGLVIVDDQGIILYRKVFSKEDVSAKIVEKAVKSRESILIVEDKLVLSKRLDEVFLIVYSPQSVNEPFVSKAFNEFAHAFAIVVKTCTRDRVWKKYDQIVLLVSGFVYEGILISRKEEEMVERLPKRNFEGVDGMAVPKGFASLIHKATKSLGLINK